jgi:phosphotransferase system enzyme I (PtsP)
VAQVQNALQRIDAYDLLVLDAAAGQIILRPSEEVIDLTTAAMEARARQRAAYAAVRDEPSITRDGVHVGLYLNAGLVMDLQALDETNAAGIGLYRTEMPFLALPTLPDVRAQQTLYRQVVDTAKGRPVTFRTLDVGGDKIAASTSTVSEDNPAMGWRSIRLTLDRPSLLRQQLRALLTANAGRALRVMFPMIATLAEFDAARRILDMELDRQKRRGDALPAEVKVGTMLEVPSLLWQIEAVAARADFISVGSNDLMQFIFAADRGNTRVAARYDTLSIEALRMLKSIVDRCANTKVELSVCGEMAGRPLEAMALLALGFRTLSMSATAIGPVRAMVRSLDLAEASSYVRDLLAAGPPTLREYLRAFAQDRGIALG